MAIMKAKMEFDSRLVDLVRANPMLYEKEVRTTPYEQMKKKTELWRSIASSLQMDTNYCIVRWKNLRHKFRLELEKSRDMERKAGGAKVKGSAWHLLDKMRFLESHIKYHGLHNTKRHTQHISSPTWNEMDAEQLIEEVTNEDDPLQEAMDEQSIQRDKEIAIATSTTIMPSSSGGAISTTVKLNRIAALLEGLDEPNRMKAEKRIVAYLCKCQLKSLNNEDVDDIII